MRPIAADFGVMMTSLQRTRNAALCSKAVISSGTAIQLIASAEMSGARINRLSTRPPVRLRLSSTLRQPTQIQPTFDGLAFLGTLTTLIPSLLAHVARPPTSVGNGLNGMKNYK